jgi:ribosome-binding protein aMBF1 (putative translation factor)
MKRKQYRPAKSFVEKLLKDPEIRVHYEAERAKTLIAEAVRSARLQAGLTQVELAKLAQTTQAVISRIESGTDTRTPSLELLSRIAGACKASLSFSFSFSRKKAA